MAHSFPTPQTAMNHYLQSPVQIHDPSQIQTYPIFAPVQYSKSVALWHSTTAAAQQPTTPTSATPFTPSSSSSSSLKHPPVLPPATDQKKHKRTRSGCFTCRSRRIKCDETRPVCERCRKGNRECVYPSSSKHHPRPGVKSKGSQQSHESDSSPQVEQDDARPLDPIADEEGEDGSFGSGSRPSPSSTATGTTTRVREKQSSQSLGMRKSKQDRREASSSPSTESSKFDAMSTRSASVGHLTMEPFALRRNSCQLPQDLRFYLIFHQESMNHHHYLQNQRSETFIRHSIVNLALQYEPLLYAVVGFSAYHYCLQTATGNLSTFLKYYNKALSLLRKSLGSGESHSEATLITILVLTTFEV